jgi:hypothetical protein
MQRIRMVAAVHILSTIGRHTVSRRGEEIVMEGHRIRRGGWIVAAIAALLAAVVGVLAYNAGVAQGLAQTGQNVVGPGAYGPYGWYHPWGFGFFGPFLFLAFWFFVLRGLFWGGPWRHYGYYGHRYYEPPPTFDEWHRRAHEHMTKEPSPPPADDDRSRR